MFALIIVIQYYMVCLTTVSKGYKKKTTINRAVIFFCKLAKFYHISDVFIDGLSLPSCPSVKS